MLQVSLHSDEKRVVMLCLEFGLKKAFPIFSAQWRCWNSNIFFSFFAFTILSSWWFSVSLWMEFVTEQREKLLQYKCVPPVLLSRAVKGQVDELSNLKQAFGICDAYWKQNTSIRKNVIGRFADTGLLINVCNLRIWSCNVGDVLPCLFRRNCLD